MENKRNFTPLSALFGAKNDQVPTPKPNNFLISLTALVVAGVIVSAGFFVMSRFVLDQNNPKASKVVSSSKAVSPVGLASKSCLLPPKVSGLQFDCIGTKAVCAWDLQGSGVLYATKVVGRYEGQDYLVVPAKLSASNRLDFEGKAGFEYECSVASSVSCGNTEEVKVRGVCKDAPSQIGSALPVTPSIYASPTSTPVKDVDLFISASDQSDPITLGNTINYTITAKNLGKDSAKNVVISSFLPSTTSYVSSSITRGKCTHSSGLLTCVIDEMMGNDSVIVTLSVVASNAGKYTNYNNIKSDTKELILANNVASQETTISSSVDLVLSGVKTSDPIGVGQNQTITYIVSNYGPSSATGVAFNVGIPSGMSFVSAGANTGTCSNSSTNVNCSLGTLPKFGSSRVSIVYTPTQIQTTNFSANVTSSDSEKDSSNNSLVITSTSQAISPSQVDMSVFLTDALDPVRSGENETYTATVKNNSAFTASNVTVNIAMSTILTYVSAFPTLGSCSIIPSANGSGGVLSCVLGTMTSNQVATITLTTKTTFNGEANLMASVSSSETDSQLSNNKDDESTLVTPQNDLTLSFDSNTFVVATDSSVNLDMILGNLGPTDASNVTLKATLPGNFVSEDVYSTSGSCPEAGGVITCLIGNLLKNQIVRLRITGRFIDVGSYQVKGEVLSSENEQILANNTGQISVTVSGPTPTLASEGVMSENYDESSDSAKINPDSLLTESNGQNSYNTVLGSYDSSQKSASNQVSTPEVIQAKKQFPVWALFLMLFGVIGMAVML